MKLLIILLGLQCSAAVSSTTESSIDKENYIQKPNELYRYEHCKPLKAGHYKPDAVLGLKKEIKLWEAMLVMVGVGIISALVATGFNAVRKHVFHDSGNIDTTFDAGGSVSISLTASSVISHWTWGATILVSSTVAAKFGISGPYYYAAGAAIQIIIFSILSIQLKLKAPGAKTFLQVIYVRFGKLAHLTFSAFALLTNTIIVIALMVAGIAVVVGLVEELTSDLAAILLGLIIGSYTFIGGLGATFYVSYFNTALIYSLICWLVVEVFYNPSSNPENPFGSAEALFKLVDCWSTSEGIRNNEQSFLTFYSIEGVMFGITNIVLAFGCLICDQAYWQKSIAAKPVHGVWGFILGALSWFAVPFAMATTMGLAYIGLNSAHGRELLSTDDVQSGLITPFVAQTLLGRNGAFIMLILILMATMATGASEVIAVASIVVYDIYYTHLRPYKLDLEVGRCILCEKWNNKPIVSKEEMCHCPSMANCSQCKIDDLYRADYKKKIVKPQFKCSVHGEFRTYQEALLQYKNWWIVIVTALVVAVSMIAWYLHLNINWVYCFIGVLISAAVFPISFSVLWTKATSTGMVVGSIGGLMLGIISWLCHASTLPGGLSDFLKNTGNELSMLIGNLVSIVSGGLLCVIVSILSKRKWTDEELEAEWEKTRNIDNPLHPWVENYQNELQLESVGLISERPSLNIVKEKFRSAWHIAIVVTVILVALLIFVIPVSMLLGTILSYIFQVWTSIAQTWVFIAMAFAIIAPLVQELWIICHHEKTHGVDNYDGIAITNYTDLNLKPMLDVHLEDLKLTMNKRPITETHSNTDTVAL